MFFVDNLRILLTILVISHHISITYGAPGSWYHREGVPDMLSAIILTLFVAVNQAFFMGFFFMISGYFVPGSYDRKGGGKFLKDRLMRLGIPLVFYMVVIDPLLRASGYSGRYRSFCALPPAGDAGSISIHPCLERPASRSSIRFFV